MDAVRHLARAPTSEGQCDLENKTRSPLIHINEVIVTYFIGNTGYSHDLHCDNKPSDERGHSMQRYDMRYNTSKQLET